MLNNAGRNAGKTPDFSEIQRRNTMAEEIKCTEISTLGEEARISFDIASLQLKLDHSDCQKKGYKLSIPYASKDHQITGIPLIYFQETIDPATAEVGARKHYRYQSQTERIYVSIVGYSHLNLLGMAKCQTGLWDAISQGTIEVEKNLKTCTDPNIKILYKHSPHRSTGK